MNYFDIAILVPLAWGAYRGFSKGFIKTIASLAALIIGIGGAVLFAEFFSDLLKNKFGYTSEFTPVFTFAIIFIALVVAVHLLAGLLDKIIKAVALGPINRIVGSVFNIVKSAFIISVVLTLFNTIDENFEIVPKEQKEKSLLYEPVLKLSPLVFKFLKFDYFGKRDVEDGSSTGSESEDREEI